MRTWRALSSSALLASAVLLTGACASPAPAEITGKPAAMHHGVHTPEYRFIQSVEDAGVDRTQNQLIITARQICKSLGVGSPPPAVMSSLKNDGFRETQAKLVAFNAVSNFCPQHLARLLPVILK